MTDTKSAADEACASAVVCPDPVQVLIEMTAAENWIDSAILRNGDAGAALRVACIIRAAMMFARPSAVVCSLL